SVFIHRGFRGLLFSGSLPTIDLTPRFFAGFFSAAEFLCVREAILGRPAGFGFSSVFIGTLLGQQDLQPA
ncbi:hypothetical protein ACMTAU_06375, partial [Alcaligenes pakistanensis]